MPHSGKPGPSETTFLAPTIRQLLHFPLSAKINNHRTLLDNIFMETEKYLVCSHLRDSDGSSTKAYMQYWLKGTEDIKEVLLRFLYPVFRLTPSFSSLEVDEWCCLFAW